MQGKSTAWQLTTTDATAALQVAAPIGLRTYIATATNLPITFSFDNFTVAEVPAASATITYTYDKLYRLSGASSPSGPTIYSYDPTGNRLSKLLNGSSTGYTYDKTDRIVTAGTTTSSYDRADRITAAGATTYTVNANGNLTARGSDTFAYDQANRLKSLVVGGASASYTYDGDCKRASSTVAGITTNFVYDVSGKLPMLLMDSTHKYVYGQGLAYGTDLLGNVQAVTHADGLGSVRALSDASGTLIQTYRTDPFGVPMAMEGTSTQPFGFTGAQTDPTGLVYLRARMYDPQLGRFLQRDTVAKAGIGQKLAAEALARGVRRVYAGTRQPLAHLDDRVTAPEPGRHQHGADSRRLPTGRVTRHTDQQRRHRAARVCGLRLP